MGQLDIGDNFSLFFSLRKATTNENKSAQSNLGKGPRRGGLQSACVAVRGGLVRHSVHS